MNLLLVIVIQASFYALLGMGYVLIYRATRVLNLAHGDLMVFGAFLFFQGLVVSNGDVPLSVVVGLAGAAVLGPLTYLGIMRPWPAIRSLACWPRSRSAAFRHDVDLVRADTISAEYLGQLGDPIEIIPGLSIGGLSRSSRPRSSRWRGFRCCCSGPHPAWRCGVCQNPLLAAQRGIDIHSINALSWAAATLMATVAGIFALVRLGPDIWYVGLAGFAPALIGGMDSLRGSPWVPSSQPPKSRRTLHCAADHACRPVSRALIALDQTLGHLWSREELERIWFFTGLPSTLRTNYRRDSSCWTRLRPLLGRRRACRRAAVAVALTNFDRHRPARASSHRCAGAQSAHGHDWPDFSRACGFTPRRFHGRGIGRMSTRRSW
jgi:branched-chain amino acid transport system permease protein